MSNEASAAIKDGLKNQDYEGIIDNPAVKEAAKTYGPYLEEAQRRLLRTLIVFFAAALIGALEYKRILNFIMNRFDLTGINIVLTSPYQVIELAIQTGIYFGLLVAVPVLIYNLITFLKPGLEDEEYRFLTSLIPVSLGLFVTGFLFGVWVMNFIIDLFSKATTDFAISNIWDISRFFSQILFSAILLGLVFQFPIVLSALIRFNFVTKKKLIEWRPFVYVAALIFAAALPPTDVFSLVLLVMPLFVLFEITLIVSPEPTEATILKKNRSHKKVVAAGRSKK